MCESFSVIQVRWHCSFIHRFYSCTLCHHFSHKIKIWTPIFPPHLVTFNFTVETSLYRCTGPRPGNCMLPGYQTDVSIYGVTWPQASWPLYCFHIGHDRPTHTLDWLWLSDGDCQMKPSVAGKIRHTGLCREYSCHHLQDVLTSRLKSQQLRSGPISF